MKKQKFWNNVTILTINEALRIGHIKYEKTLITEFRGYTPSPPVVASAYINENTFEFSILDHVVRARLNPVFCNCELSFSIVINPEPNHHKYAHLLSSEPTNYWEVKKYKNSWVCSAMVFGFMEIEKGPYICPSSLSRFALKIRKGFGEDILALNPEPNGYVVRKRR